MKKETLVGFLRIFVKMTTHAWVGVVFCTLVLLVTACSQPLTPREHRFLIGTALGAATGAIIGAAIGAPGAGAAIGGALGGVGQAVVGDQLPNPLDGPIGLASAPEVRQRWQSTGDCQRLCAGMVNPALCESNCENALSR